jgi:predicted permease
VSRPVALLAGALIPTMLVALGAQLAAAGIPRPNLDMALASAVRLLVGPALALALAAPFGLAGVERGVGVLQASMPAAVLASIIALENDLLPEFVTTTVLFSTLASIVTLTFVLTLI